MKLFESIKKKILITITLIPAGMIAAAQDAAKNNTAAEKDNLVAVLLTVVAIVLAFIIWGMGQALVSISRMVLDKHKNAGKILGLILIAGSLLSAQNSFAQETSVASASANIPNYGGLSANNFYAFAGVIFIEITAIFFLAFFIRRMYQELVPAKTIVKTSRFSAWWNSLDKKFFTRAVPVEREADVLLDHDYDGIRELDNSLPPWWKYGFYITIVAAFVYMFIFHVSGEGKNPTEEYAVEMEKAKIEKEIFEANNKDKVDESNIPMADAAGIKEGQDLFEANCVACHLKGGAGNVGPNLTDDYWIHKGSLNDIFQSIKKGYPDKGMQAWDMKFNPKEISLISSYIKSLHGTNPPGAKAPQGDLFVERSKADSTASTADSSKTAITLPVEEPAAKIK